MSEHEPQVQQRAEQPYVAIPAHVTSEAEFRRATDSGFPELFGWLQQRGVPPAGPLFIRYLVVDDDGDPREIELGVPVAPGIPGDERVRSRELPAGRWATFVHVGPYRSETEPDLAEIIRHLDEQVTPSSARRGDDARPSPAHDPPIA